MISKKMFTGVLEILFIFVFPVLALFLEIIGIEYRHFILLFIVCVIIAIILHRRWSLKELGIRRDNLKEVVLPYTWFTLLGTVVILTTGYFSGNNPNIARVLDLKHLLLMIPLSFAQEFMYRSFLMLELRRLCTSKNCIVLVSAILFSFLHIFYAPWEYILPLTFVGGLAFGFMYLKYPNLFAIGAAHSILNFLMILCFEMIP